MTESKNQKQYYTINCYPDKQNYHEHSTGLFSSEKTAQSCIPRSGRSYDMDDDITWSYTVSPISSDLVDEHKLQKLDETPPNFPYRGF
jgi:hypothetical protein